MLDPEVEEGGTIKLDQALVFWACASTEKTRLVTSHAAVTDASKYSSAPQTRRGL